MSELTKAAAAGLPSLQNLRDGLVYTASAMATQPGGGAPFLRFLQSGKWVYGQGNTEAEQGSQWAANPYDMKKGYVCWTNRGNIKNELLGERWVGLADPFPEDLPVMTDEKNGNKECVWKEAFKIPMVCVTGEDKGQEVLYNPSSYGGNAAVNELINAIVRQLDTDPNNIVPLMTLEHESYQHKVHGETFNPILTIVGWTDLEGTASVAEPEPIENDGAAQAEEAAAAEQHVTTRRRRRA